MENTQGSLFGRTYPERSAATTDTTSQPFSRAWWADRLGLPPPTEAGQAQALPLDPRAPWSGAYSTLNISESPNDAAESSLSTILEETAPAKYFLSPRACAGILARATKRGRTLPAALQVALEKEAAKLEESTATASE